MKVYTVVVGPLDGFMIFSPHDFAYNDRAEAERAAQEKARELRGETVYVIEGEPVAAFRAEPVRVDAVPV